MTTTTHTTTTDAPPDAPHTSVRIEAHGITVQIDADEPMADVSERALQLYIAAGARPPHRHTIGFSPTTEAPA